jgi:hypothetical protein
MTGSVVLSDGTNTYSLGTSYAYGGDFNLYNNTGVYVPAGTYNVTITLDNTGTGASSVSSTGIVCATSMWRLYKITDANTNNPIVSTNPVASGYGQINTHINTASNKLFFGIFEGDRCYYQFDPSDNSTIAFKPANEDFYWAGAANVGSYMVFGSESGKVYKRPIGADFALKTMGDLGFVIDLCNTVSNPGSVRSSVCYDNSNLYLTTRNGYLWKINTGLTSAVALDIKDASYVSSSTSTPVVSGNGYVYVGGYGYDYTTYQSLGAIKAVPVNNFDSAHLTTIWQKSGEGVQSSPVVYSRTKTKTDYLYFTTNAYLGYGYCISHVTTTGVTASIWDTVGETGSTYTLQGMAVSDSGYVVFGNDANYLYIVH